MYGINLKYRFPMLCAMIGSGLVRLLCGLNGVIANSISVGGLSNILSVPLCYYGDDYRVHYLDDSDRFCLSA